MVAFIFFVMPLFLFCFPNIYNLTKSSRVESPRLRCEERPANKTAPPRSTGHSENILRIFLTIIPLSLLLLPTNHHHGL